jgi:hypothetical protein
LQEPADDSELSVAEQPEGRRSIQRPGYLATFERGRLDLLLSHAGH